MAKCRGKATGEGDMFGQRIGEKNNMLPSVMLIHEQHVNITRFFYKNLPYKYKVLICQKVRDT